MNGRDDVKGAAALADLTPEHRERLRAAVRLMIAYLLDNATLNCNNETEPEVESVSATDGRVVQLHLEL